MAVIESDLNEQSPRSQDQAKTFTCSVFSAHSHTHPLSLMLFQRITREGSDKFRFTTKTLTNHGRIRRGYGFLTSEDTMVIVPASISLAVTRQ